MTFLHSQICKWPFFGCFTPCYFLMIHHYQTALHHCTFRFVTTHFVHHCTVCTLKQAPTKTPGHSPQERDIYSRYCCLSVLTPLGAVWSFLRDRALPAGTCGVTEWLMEKWMDVRMDGGMERRWEKLQKHRMEDGGWTPGVTGTFRIDRIEIPM